MTCYRHPLRSSLPSSKERGRINASLTANPRPALKERGSFFWGHASLGVPPQLCCLSISRAALLRAHGPTAEVESKSLNSASPTRHESFLNRDAVASLSLRSIWRRLPNGARRPPDQRPRTCRNGRDLTDDHHSLREWPLGRARCDAPEDSSRTRSKGHRIHQRQVAWRPDDRSLTGSFSKSQIRNLKRFDNAHRRSPDLIAFGDRGE